MTQRILQVAQGQVMLISVMVLGFLTLGFVVLGIATASQTSQSATVIENKSMASAAAAACVEQAINRLGINAGYAGNEVLTAGAQTCIIRPIIALGGTWTIEASAQVGDQYARSRVILTSRAPVVIGSWNEVAGF